MNVTYFAFLEGSEDFPNLPSWIFKPIARLPVLLHSHCDALAQASAGNARTLLSWESGDEKIVFSSPVSPRLDSPKTKMGIILGERT